MLAMLLTGHRACFVFWTIFPFLCIEHQMMMMMTTALNFNNLRSHLLLFSHLSSNPTKEID
jgi:hypothetical protein